MEGAEFLSSGSNVNSGQGPRLSFRVDYKFIGLSPRSWMWINWYLKFVACLGALLVRLTRVAILGSNQILTTTDAPLFPLSLSSREEWSGPIYILTWEVKALLAFWKEAVKMSFHILSLLWKLEWVWTASELMIRIFTSWWTRSCGRGESGWFDMLKISRRGPVSWGFENLNERRSTSIYKWTESFMLK